MMRKMFRKTLAMLTTVSLCTGGFVSGIPAMNVCASEESQEMATAISVRVLETDGVVEVTNQCGVTMPVFVNMKLQTGYEVMTEEASYAWMVLDDVKTAELDAVSDMKVQRKGEELALMLEAGNMFFDVEEKLEEEESMSIRTSTMVMGIRGTAGMVKCKTSKWSQVYIMDGEVEIELTNPITGEIKTAVVKAGQLADCYIYDKDYTGDSAEIIISSYAIEDIDGFVLKYLAGHSKTKDRIAQSGGGDFTEAAEKADERLKKDQEEVHKKLEGINDEYKKLNADGTLDKVYKETETESAGYEEPYYEESNTGGSTTTSQKPKKPKKTAETEAEETETETETESETETETETERQTMPETETESETQAASETETETESETQTQTHSHTVSTYKSNGDATCTANGTMTGYCDECGVEVTMEEAGTSLGHSLVEAYNTKPTCTEEGLMWFECERCGDMESMVYEDAYGHSFTTYDPDPDDGGYQIAYCDYGCGASDRIPVE